MFLPAIDFSLDLAELVISLQVAPRLMLAKLVLGQPIELLVAEVQLLVDPSLLLKHSELKHYFLDSGHYHLGQFKLLVRFSFELPQCQHWQAIIQLQ